MKSWPAMSLREVRKKKIKKIKNDVIMRKRANSLSSSLTFLLYCLLSFAFLSSLLFFPSFLSFFSSSLAPFLPSLFPFTDCLSTMEEGTQLKQQNWVLALSFIFAFALAFGLGANDAANSILSLSFLSPFSLLSLSFLSSLSDLFSLFSCLLCFFVFLPLHVMDIQAWQPLLDQVL